MILSIDSWSLTMTRYRPLLKSLNSHFFKLSDLSKISVALTTFSSENTVVSLIDSPSVDFEQLYLGFSNCYEEVVNFQNVPLFIKNIWSVDNFLISLRENEITLVEAAG